MPGRQVLHSMVLATMVALAGGGCAHEQGPTAPQVDVALTVARDGSLQVQETIRVEIDRPITSFRRKSPALHHDGIRDVRATLDGADVPASSADHLDVRWSFPAMTGSHTFGLSYRAVGAVRISGIRGRVSWLAMPADRSFDIGRMNVQIALPERVVQLGDPWVMEAGWTVAREPLGMRATRNGLPTGEPVHVGAEFTIDTLSLAQPAWQYHEDRAEEFRLAFVSAGGFLLVVAAGILVMIRVRLASLEPDARDAERITTARGLRITAFVTLGASVIGWVLVRQTLDTFGPWPYTMPICTLLSGALFLWEARRLARASQDLKKTSQMKTKGLEKG